jgi:hypothetical protein
MKKLILSSIFALVALVSYGQVGSPAYGGVFYRVTDTTTYQSAASTRHTQNYFDIYWNQQATTPHWDVWNGSGYDHIFDFNSSGGGAWGTITGTLSDQTDLQAALDAKAPLASPALTGTPTAPTASAGTNNTQIATTAYADNASSTIVLANKWKQSVAVSSTANGTLATAFENGDTQDGVTLTTGMRILIQFQTTTTDNGIYTVNASGAPTRATDADVAAELEGAVVLVQQGTIYRNQVFQQVTDAITLGSSGIIFIRDQPFVTPEQFGALGNGSTDDNAAITAALATGQALSLDGSKNYRVTTSVTVPDNAVVIGNGATISTASAIHIFTLGSNITIDNLNFAGNNTGVTGITVNGVFRNKLSNSYATGFTYASLYVTQTAGAADYEGGITVSNSYFENNSTGTGRGVYLYTNAEYNNFTNCTTRGNISGLVIRGGNNTWTGGKITDNSTVGVDLEDGSNDGHGSVTDALINHNAINIRATDITNGFVFNDNNIFAGNITIVTSKGIIFNDNLIGGTSGTITQTTNTFTEWNNNHFLTDFTWTTTGTGQSFLNNRFETGTIPTIVRNSLLGGLDLTANIPAGVTSIGTFTTTANNQQHWLVDGTVTTRATTSDNYAHVRIKPTSITAGAASQSIYGLEVDHTGAGTGNSPSKYAINAVGGILASTNASATATNTLTLSTVNTQQIFRVVYNSSDYFLIGNTSGGSFLTGIPTSVSSNGFALAGTLNPSGGNTALVALNSTQTATANNDNLKGISLLNTFGVNSRTGVKPYILYANANISVSSGSFVPYGIVIDQTASSQIFKSGLNAGPTPTAQLHIGASTTAASSGQIKLAEGTALTTPEDGNLNYVANNLQFTEGSTVYTLAKTLTATATLNFDLTAVNYEDLTMTVTGAVSGDVVAIGVPAGAVVADVTYFGWVSGADTVSIRCSRVGGGGAADPASGTFRASVVKY